jgi:hypothetical protein
MTSANDKSVDVPLSRISEYLRGLSILGREDAIVISELMALLPDVTLRQFREDCDVWEISWTSGTIDSPVLSRAVRRELHKRKHHDVVVGLEPALIPDPKSFLTHFDGDALSSRQAAPIEAAYAYAVADHGISSPRTATSSAGSSHTATRSRTRCTWSRKCSAMASSCTKWVSGKRSPRSS